MQLTGRDLRAERVRQGLTQAELASRLGVTSQRIGNAERSITVTTAFAARYFDALGVDGSSHETTLPTALDECPTEAAS
jgi:transcriptional regulator with XRE-family HTH domain